MQAQQEAQGTETVSRKAAPKREPNRPQIEFGTGGLTPKTFDELYRMAEVFHASELAGKTLDSVPKIIVAIQLGADLGLSPAQSIRCIYVVNQRPTIFGDAMLAICKASPAFDHGAFVEEERGEFPKDTFEATCYCRRRAVDAKTVTGSFSVADAKKAGLWGKQGPWQNYPRRMLQMRARALALRDAFPDLLTGIHAAEEVISADAVLDQIDLREPFDPEKTRGDNLAARLASANADQEAESLAEPPQGERSDPAVGDHTPESPETPQDAPEENPEPGPAEEPVDPEVKAAWTKIRAGCKRMTTPERKKWLDNVRLQSIDDLEGIFDMDDLRSIMDAMPTV